MKNDNLIPSLLFLTLLTFIPIWVDAQFKIKVINADDHNPIENVIIEDASQQRLGVTDKYGYFETRVKVAMPIQVRIDNYFNEKVDATGQEVKMVYLKPQKAKEEIVLLYETRPREFMTSSVSFLKGSVTQNTAATNRLNTLAGRLTGLSVMQTDGLPGNEDSNVKIRGQHTIGNRPGITVLVDGRQTDITMLDPYDIESITVLKDAAATAIYGMNGGNGILMVNTKRGKEGRLRIEYNGQASLQEPLSLPKFLNAYQYAILYNEAMLNDDPNSKPLYTLHDIEGYRSGKSPYAYPDVDWVDLFMKDYTFQNRHNINVSGGSQAAKYFVSFGYVNNSGIFNTDDNINTYRTNSKVSALNIHGNLELNINKNFMILADIKAKKDMRTAPGSFSNTYDQNILASLYSTPSNAFQPITYNGQLGGWYNGSNPYGMLNYSGYSNIETNFISSTVDLRYDLGDFIKGLSVLGYFGVNSTTDYITDRSKTFASYILNPSATIWYKRGEDGAINSSGRYSAIARKFDHMIGLNYKETFGGNDLDILVMADRQQMKEHLFSSIGETFQGLKGKVSYKYNNKYVLDLSGSYQGSNYYPKQNRYGFFPAIGAGWVVSNESFMEGIEAVNHLKVRGSYGKTGNHIGTAFATYYGYLDNFSTGSGAYIGNSLNRSTGMYQSRVGNDQLTWEKATKYNIGLDFSLLKDRLSGAFDYFNEKNRDILVKNAISVMYGAEVWMPHGKMTNSGYEVELGWADKINNLSYSVSANYSFARNIVDEKNEEIREYPWMYETGHPYGTYFGYVFDRYFTEDDDFTALPDQSLLGEVQPGDLKYKDLNDDNIIDQSDRTMIAKSTIPETFYGISFGVAYKGFDFSTLLQGVRNYTVYNSGATYWAFHNQTGNVMEHHLDRWTPGSGQQAEYPRLSLTSTNNTQTSSFWVQNTNFLRLKNVELGYSLPHSIVQKIGVGRTRIFINGNNLYVWSKTKNRDPEGDISRYPLMRTLTGGVNISF